LYRRFVEGIKERIRTAQLKAALAANAELVLHYWEIGREILANQEREGWGAKVIDRLAADLQREFPKLAGYSSRNLKYMRAFAVAWPDRAIMQQLAAQMPWAHNCVLLDRVKDAKTREFYIRETVGQGWSRSVLVHHLDTDLHKRAGKAPPSNFALTLPSAQSDLAKELLKDPYVFKPAPLDESANERALESALITRLKDFLIELGSGFAFVGNQYRLEVDGEEFFLDLLFYHTRLHCYIVIDLKVGDFKPEFVGKMNFYQAAVDSLVKTTEDGASEASLRPRPNLPRRSNSWLTSAPNRIASFNVDAVIPVPSSQMIRSRGLSLYSMNLTRTFRALASTELSMMSATEASKL
jgi:predicted nuclease of restriction endonuclease-like (RecB) superfamily